MTTHFVLGFTQVVLCDLLFQYFKVSISYIEKTT